MTDTDYDLSTGEFQGNEKRIWRVLGTRTRMFVSRENAAVRLNNGLHVSTVPQ